MADIQDGWQHDSWLKIDTKGPLWLSNVINLLKLLLI